MEYYLSKMKCKVHPLDDEIEVIQLVKANSPDLAREDVEESALNECGGKIMIFEIRIQETLTGR